MEKQKPPFFDSGELRDRNKKNEELEEQFSRLAVKLNDSGLSQEEETKFTKIKEEYFATLDDIGGNKLDKESLKKINKN